MSTSNYIESLNEFETRQICEHFAIGDYVAFYRELGGGVNLNSCIQTTTGFYVLRIQRDCDIHHLAYQAYIQSVLHHHGVPVVFPCKTASGRLYSFLKQHVVQVFPYVNGTIFSNEPTQIIDSGKMLRKFHAALENIELNAVPAASLYPTIGKMRRGINRLKRYRKDITKQQLKACTELLKTVTEQWGLYVSELPQTIIHGDWHTGNLCYTSSGEVKCIFDFDTVQRGERIYDVAYALWTLMYLDDSPNYDHAQLFLHGYGDLLPAELNALPIALSRVCLFMICSPYPSEPVREFHFHLARQTPIIEWLLSNEGKQQIYSLCTF